MSTTVQDEYLTKTFGLKLADYGAGGADSTEQDAPVLDDESDNDAEKADAPAPDAPAPDDQAEADTGKTVSDASDKVKALKDEDLQKLSGADKAKLLKDLQAGGKPTGEARDEQRRILRNMKLDPAFKAAEDKRGDNIAKSLKGDKALEEARKNWATLSDDDKIAALKKVVAAQSKEYGMPAPEITKELKAPYTAADGKEHIENGNFNPADGKLHLNTHPKSKLANFGRALDLVLHENGHNYQAKLIKDLKDGKLKPEDPEYTQATIFAANDGGAGYVQPSEDNDTYVKQPKENHSRTIGAETSKKILDAL